MPSTMPKVWEQIGLSADNATYDNTGSFNVLPADVTVCKGDVLFPRIDAEKEIEELNAIISANLPKEEAPAEEIVLEPEISIEDFAKVELRVGKVTACEKVKKSSKLLCLQVDDGMGGRQIVSGIAKWYKPDDLIGKKVQFVANLKPVKLCGVESNGMICAAETTDGDVKVIFVDDSLPAGSKIR
jgi:methionyl-tRNA synthetase